MREGFVVVQKFVQNYCDYYCRESPWNVSATTDVAIDKKESCECDIGQL